jgi:hypothetical protein
MSAIPVPVYRRRLQRRQTLPIAAALFAGYLLLGKKGK